MFFNCNLIPVERIEPNIILNGFLFILTQSNFRFFYYRNNLQSYPKATRRLQKVDDVQRCRSIVVHARLRSYELYFLISRSYLAGFSSSFFCIRPLFTIAPIPVVSSSIVATSSSDSA